MTSKKFSDKTPSFLNCGWLFPEWWLRQHQLNLFKSIVLGHTRQQVSGHIFLLSPNSIYVWLGGFEFDSSSQFKDKLEINLSFPTNNGFRWHIFFKAEQMENVSNEFGYLLTRFGGIPTNISLPNLMITMENNGGVPYHVIFKKWWRLAFFRRAMRTN